MNLHLVVIDEGAGVVEGGSEEVSHDGLPVEVVEEGFLGDVI